MITESRVKDGVLTLGGEVGPPVVPGVSFACQATNVHLTPKYDDDGDAIETLCGDTIPAGKKESWTLGGTSVQDFDDPLGFIVYCRDHAMQTVSFTWAPNQTGAETVSGSLVVLAIEYGGDVNTRLTADWEFDISGTLTYVPFVEGLETSEGETADVEPESVNA